MSDARAIVFDLFHTLVDPEDHRPADFHRAAIVAEIIGVPAAPFVRWWDSLEEARTRGTAPSNDQLFVRAAADAGVEVDHEALVEADRIYGRYQDRAILDPRPEILDTVRALHDAGRPLGLLSNAERRDTRAWLDSPLAPWFETAVFSCDVGAVKPEPRLYGAALDALNVSSDDTVYVGDGGSDELTGARDVGIGRVIAARWFVPANGLRTQGEQRHAERDADVVARDVGDLLTLL